MSSGSIRGIRSQLLEAKIFAKWICDRFSLPLEPQHYRLYRTIHRYYFCEFQRLPNLRTCPTYNDKIQWLKLFDQAPEIVSCTDKLGAREYVRKRIGQNFLVDLLQTSNSFDDIDFEKLPNSFVIKTKS